MYCGTELKNSVFKGTSASIVPSTEKEQNKIDKNRLNAELNNNVFSFLFSILTTF